MKTCTMCKQELPATNEYFSIGRKSLRSSCKSCRTEQSKKIILEYSKDRLRNYKKKYRENNRESIRAGHSVYKKANPEKNCNQARVYQARKLGNGHSPYTEQQVLKTYGTNCNICNISIDLNAARQVGKPGWQKGLHIDHLIPISKNGPDTLENVRPTHGLCNITKNNKEIYENQTA